MSKKHLFCKIDKYHDITNCNRLNRRQREKENKPNKQYPAIVHKKCVLNVQVKHISSSHEAQHH